MHYSQSQEDTLLKFHPSYGNPSYVGTRQFRPLQYDHEASTGNRKYNCFLLFSIIMSVFCIIPSPYLTIPSLVAVGYAIKNKYEFPKKKKYAELSFCLSLSAFMCGLLTLVFVFVIATSIVGYIESENFKK